MSEITGKELIEAQHQIDIYKSQIQLLQDSIEKLKQEASSNKSKREKESEDMIAKIESGYKAKQTQLEDEISFLQNKIQQLEETFTNSTDTYNAREDQLRSEIEDLRKRCLVAEKKHEALIQSFPQTTSPLLHQIDTLEQAAIAKQERWIQQEKQYQQDLKQAKEALDRQLKISEKATKQIEDLVRFDGVLFFSSIYLFCRA